MASAVLSPVPSLVVPQNYSNQAQSVLPVGKNRILGRLVHSNDSSIPSNEELPPVASTILRLYQRSHLIASTKTDANGNFAFSGTLNLGWCSSTVNLTIKIVQENHVFKALGYDTVLDQIPCIKKKRDIDDNLGVVELRVLETAFRRISDDISLIPTPIGDQVPTLSYFFRLGSAAIPLIGKRVISAVLSGLSLSASKVQWVFDRTFFGLQHTHPKMPITVELLIDQLQNGILYGNREIDLEKGEVTFFTNFPLKYFVRGDSLPQVKVVLKIVDFKVREIDEEAKEPDVDLRNCRLQMSSISYAYQQQVVDGQGNKTFVLEEPTAIAYIDGKPSHEALLKDPEAELKALKNVSNAFGYDGEAGFHLTWHLMFAMISETFPKYITSVNPFFKLVFPHIKGNVFINDLGQKGVVYNQGAVLNDSALSDVGVREYILSCVKSHSNWKDFRPSEPISINDKRSRAQEIYYRELHGFVSEYIGANKEQIAASWIEIYRWSKKMTQKEPALPLITTKQQNPDAEDIDNLVKFTVWLIHGETFGHWMAHSRQQLLTDVSQSSLAMRNRGLDKDGRVDPFSNTPASAAINQLFVANILLGFDGTSIFEDEDIHPEFLARLNPHLNELEDLMPGFKELFRSIDI